MHALEIRGLRKTYRGVPALHGVDLTVEAGEIFGVVGPNGAGKTTLIESVAGLVHPDGGTVRVFGTERGTDPDGVSRMVGVQLQSGRLPDRLKVVEALRLFAGFYPDPAPVDELLADWALADVAHRPYGKLSGGQQQRLAIALAMVGRPRLVLLDELTTGLDPEARRRAWRHLAAIRGAGVTVVLVTHFMDEAERLCDRLAVINRGRLVACDTPAGLVRATRGDAGPVGTSLLEDAYLSLIGEPATGEPATGELMTGDAR